MEEAARPARADDAPRLAELADAARREVAAHRGGPEYLATEAGAPCPEGGRRWVGTIDGVVVGFAAAHVEAVPGASPRGVLDAVYVEPAARGVAVGERLLQAACGWLARQGCQRIDARALPGDRTTKSFLEQAGFRARLLVMSR
jgi:GNAT superfamily N-acetyltransferase